MASAVAAPIRVIFCDLVGVAIESGMPALSRQLHEQYGIDSNPAAETISKLISQADLGTQSFETFHHACMKELAAEVPLEQFRSMFLGGFGNPKRGVLDMLQLLRRKKGIKLYALSNIAPFTWEAANRKSDLQGYFDGTILSFKHQCCKPDPVFFRTALKVSGSDPKEVLFIDDSLPNIEAAARLGIQVITYKTPTQLRSDLGLLGLI